MTKDGKYYVGYITNITSTSASSWVYALQNLADYLGENTNDELRITQVKGLGYLNEIMILLEDYNVSVYTTPDGMYFVSSALNLEDYLEQETQTSATSQNLGEGLFNTQNLNPPSGDEEILFLGYIQNCSSGENIFCSFYINFTDYNYSNIMYDFALEDESGKITLGEEYYLLFEAEPVINCSIDSDCSNFTYEKYCDGNNTCETIINYTCHNPGTEESYCTSSSSGECHSCEYECNETNRECNLPPLCTPYSPQNNKIYPDRRIPFNIKATEKLAKIEYLDLDDSRPKWKRLCRNCNNYFRSKSFKEGEHKLTIKCTPYIGEPELHKITFSNDYKDPRISKTEPKRNKFTNGSNFYIKFKENNPVNISINFNPTLFLDLEDCTESRTYKECYININLSDYDDQEINYYFTVQDIAGNKDKSKSTPVKVDTTPPKINNPNSSWHNDSKCIYFDISITEKNLDKVFLTYTYRGREKTKKLCSSRLRNGKCTKKFRLKPLYKNLQLTIKDKANNQLEIPIEI